MIPEEKLSVVQHALQAAFGINNYDDIRIMGGGHTTSLVYRIAVKGTPYLLKVILRKDDPSRHFKSMRAAADAGIAPRVLYTSAEDRVLITDFIEATTVPRETALPRMAATLRALHALPRFGEIAPHLNTSCTFLLHPGPAVDGIANRFLATNALPKAESDELLARYAEIAANYPREEADYVACHNDLFKPDNALFDGQRIWLADWETAFANNRYADLAVVSHYLVTSDEDEQAFLREYFQRDANSRERAKLYLMQQLSLIFYTMAFFMMGAAEMDTTEPVPDFLDFHRRIWSGEVRLDNNRMKALYAKVYCKRLLLNTRTDRYAHSLRILSTT